MKNRARLALLAMAVVIGVAAAAWISALFAAKPRVRPAGVAGSFYPADPKELAAAVDGFLARASVPEVKGPLLALVAPHAGYPYSGAVAGHGYALLRGRGIKRVVVISPSHYDSFPFAAVFDGDAYATPLGEVPVDKEFAARLTRGSRVKLSSRGHAGAQAEHALEVQLPFLQRVLGPFKLVPVIMGDQSYEVSRALGLALADNIRGQDTLLVASSDLSHFHGYEQATALDRKTLRDVEEWDYLTLSRGLQAGLLEACGGGPVIAAMIAAERLGANQARVLKYANSGDVTGERSRVVGYAALALLRDARLPAGAAEFSLSPPERQELLRIARASVEAAVRRGRYEPPTPRFEALALERGVFVTLTKRGHLRGCIGYVVPVKPLYLAVRDVAASAALHDPRFPPVSAAELSELEYEISVLSPFRRVLDVRAIEIGRHGLLIRKGSQEGLLLPQVPVEYRWDRSTFLEEICGKAGLPPGAWKDPDTELFSFSALVFGDH